jgi:2-oxoisovalerate dehydrogenase E2 component (dihydrolipoyl transacylase)
MTETLMVPAVGDTVVEVEIVEWLIQEGDPVAVDQEVVTVETDKSTVDIPSPWRGRLAGQHAQEGEVVAVGAPLFSVDVDAS